MNLKQWRDKQGLKMAPAAKVLGTSQPTISRIERGDQFPSPKTIEKFSKRSNGAITAVDLMKAWEAARAGA